MRFAISGSSLSRARKDIVVMFAVTLRILARAWRGRPEQLGRWDRTLPLRLRSHHEDQRHAHRPSLDLVDPLPRHLIVRAGAESIDRVGGKSDDCAASHELRRPQEPGARWLQNHASRTRSRPFMSRCTRWPAKFRPVDCDTAWTIEGSSAANTRPPGRRRDGPAPVKLALSAVQIGRAHV